MLALQLDVCLGRFLYGFEGAAVYLSPMKLQLRAPLVRPAIEKNAQAPRRLVIAFCGSQVLAVHEPRHVAQIGEAVVATIPVDMVDVTDGPRAMHPQPSKPVLQVGDLVDADGPIAVTPTPSDSPNENARRRLHAPNEHSRVWAVLQERRRRSAVSASGISTSSNAG